MTERICVLKAWDGRQASFWSYPDCGLIRTFPPEDTGGVPTLETSDEVLTFFTRDKQHGPVNLPVGLAKQCFGLPEEAFYE